MTLAVKGMGSEMRLDHARDIVLGSDADHLVPDLSALEQQQGGDTPDTVLERGFLVVIHVQLQHFGATGVLSGNLFHRRSQHPAGSAPRRPEVHQNRDLGFQHFVVKLLIGNFFHMLAHELLRMRPERLSFGAHVSIRPILDPQPEPRKALGQHFLADPRYCLRIVELAAPSSDDLVIEIGPGTGALTRVLLDAGAQVSAFELDRRMVEYLNHTFAGPVRCGQLQIHHQSALDMDWNRLLDLFAASSCGSTARPVKLVANLPYNAATHILSSMTTAAERFHSWTVMTQKEVARRIAAVPGSKDYGFLSVLMALHVRVGTGFDVPPGAFLPPPKVTSRVMQLLPVPCPVEPSLRTPLLDLVGKSFAHRRKTIWNNLAGSDWTDDRLASALRQAGIDPKTRAETVSLAGFLTLARVLSCSA